MVDTGQFVPSDINNLGQMIGGFSDGTTAIWNNGVTTPLGTLGGSFTEPRAINDVGQVVGTSYLAGDSIYHGFLWQNGVMSDLGTLGGLLSDASGINNLGQIAGDANIPAVPNEYLQPFLWQNGVMANLGNLGGIGDSTAQAVNDVGQVVGGSLINNFVNHPFFCTSLDKADLT
jgi:probable HAF family extracellular repeat protein